MVALAKAKYWFTSEAEADQVRKGQREYPTAEEF